MRYRTKDGDVLDAICLAHYGADRYRVEEVLEANRGLADLGPVFPSGVIIDLPAQEAIDPPAPTIRLWS